MIRKPKKKVNKRNRLLGVFILIGIVFFALLGRLFYVMYINRNFYASKAEAQWTTDIEITPKRGSILDRNGNVLAQSIDAYRIDVDMNTLRTALYKKKMTMKELISKLSPILNMSSDDISKILYLKNKAGNPVKYATLARQIDKGESDKIKKLKINGLIVSGDSKRHYLNDNFLASTLGYINSNGDGVSGVEASYNSELSGVPGRKIIQTDNKKDQLPYEDSHYVPPVNGKNIVLTIDQQIQLYAEQAAQQALTDNKAKSVTITVMNPKNGEILAMASKPDFNPNNPSQNISGTSTSVADLWQNNAVQQSFEPGSIFKVITSYTGLITGVANQIPSFVCNGSINIGGTVIHCWQLSGHGTENFQQIIKNSCNVGFAELGMHIGKDNLMKYIKLFGFGEKTGIDLPGEASGIVRNVKNINQVDLASISFGQEISVTAVQYLTAFNSVANGGTWIRPHVMKQITHTDSSNNAIVDKKYNNYGSKKILDTNTTAQLRQYLLHVVSDKDGVGYNANVPGLDIAGKTGTAQIADAKTGSYAAGKYMSSFAGMAPVNDPKITLLVSVNQPGTGNYYASQVAAPVAQQLFTEIFKYLDVTNDAALK